MRKLPSRKSYCCPSQDTGEAVTNLSSANRGAADGARTRGLRDHNPNRQVLACSILLENFAYLCRKCGFIPCVFSVPFGSVLSLLLPRCCHFHQARGDEIGHARIISNRAKRTEKGGMQADSESSPPTEERFDELFRAARVLLKLDSEDSGTFCISLSLPCERL